MRADRKPPVSQSFCINCEIRISRRAKSSGMEIIMSSLKNRRGKRSKNRNNRSSAARAKQPANAPLPAEHPESPVPADANAADATEITLSEAAAAADHPRASFSEKTDAGDIPEMSFSGEEDATDVREMSFSGAEDEADHPERSFLDKADSATDFSRKKHRLPADRFSPTMLFGEVDPFNGDGPTDPNDKLRRAILPLAGIIACLIIVLYFQARLAGFSLIPGFSNGSSKPAAETSEPIEESQESDNTEPVPAPDTNSSESPEKSTDTPVPEEDSPKDDADNRADQSNEDTAPEEESDQSEEDVEYTEEEPEYTEEDSEEEYSEDEGDHEEEYYEDEDNYEDEGNQEYYEEEFDLREG